MLCWSKNAYFLQFTDHWQYLHTVRRVISNGDKHEHIEQRTQLNERDYFVSLAFFIACPARYASLVITGTSDAACSARSLAL